MLAAQSDFAAVEKQLGLPLFVKPDCEGSSIGISMVSKAGGLQSAYLEAAKHDSLVLAERGIIGGEYTVAILGDEALPIIKIEPATEFYDYAAKYLRDDTAYRCPCGLSEIRELELRAQALEAFRVLGCRGWGRVDFLMDKPGNAYFLEVNTSPGMTDHSLVPMAARVAGISYEQLVVRVLALATLG
jgi:D-alanine-D-alanine ligase